MPFNLNEIISEIATAGVQKTNKFLVEFSSPPSLSQSQNAQALTQTQNKLRLYCEQVNLPGVGMLTADNRRFGYGHAEKKPFAPLFTDVSMTFRGDAEGQVLTFFREWIKLAINYDLSQGIDGLNGNKFYPGEVCYKYDPSNQEGYATDLIIHTYKDDSSESGQTTLRMAYPILLGDQSLGWADNNQYMKIPVIMTYYDWFSSEIQQG